jgi:predicted CxxxxCH...CXXCH cytochrome family protein
MKALCTAGRITALARRRGLWRRIVAGAAALVGLSGCTQARELPEVFGQHPAGWTTAASPDFHGTWLRANADDVATCAACHGADYRGGPVGASCTTTGCHTSKGGPEFCGTCHGGVNGPMPATGAHAMHAPFCSDCHDVPTSVRSPGHIDGVVDVHFSGLAVTGGAKPTWNAADRTCSGVYCHIEQTPTWKKPVDEVPCDTCHAAPPESHQRWSRVAAPAPQACASCHPVPPMASHLDAEVQVTPNIPCDTCHGHGPRGAPAPALDGSTAPTSRGVGAHERHLDETLADRMGRVVACEACHPVPASVTAKGHLDTSAPADVVLPKGGAYDAVTQSCVVGCHWDRSPGPVWTDDSGAARACDACHGFPPVLLRNGTPHTVVAPALSECLACHPFTPATHVDGTVNLAP